MTISRERGLRWFPAALPLILLATAAATSCGSPDDGTKPKDDPKAPETSTSKIDGAWLLTKVACAKGTLTADGKSIADAAPNLKMVYEVSGAKGTLAMIAGAKEGSVCVSETPITVKYKAGQVADLTFKGSSQSVSPSAEACAIKAAKDEQHDYGFKISGNTLVLTAAAGSEDGKYCGATGETVFTFRMADSSDKPKPVTATPSPSPTPTPTPEVAEFGDLFTVSPAPGTFTHQGPPAIAVGPCVWISV